MIGASKILTVSYGTFSCTLEGFDEPFNTMKAIAEYFRDLAAEDRYFGAEPPTPDAAMLHKIAEREIQRRVEAKIDEHGVTLRAGSNAAPALAMPQAAPTVSDHPAPTETGETVAARLSRLRSAQEPDASPAPMAVAAPLPATQMAPLLEQDDYTEDQHADEPLIDMPTTAEPETVAVESTTLNDILDAAETQPAPQIEEPVVTEEPAVAADAVVTEDPVVAEEPAPMAEVEDFDIASLADLSDTLPESEADLTDDLPEAAESDFDDSMLTAVGALIAENDHIQPEPEAVLLAEPQVADLEVAEASAPIETAPIESAPVAEAAPEVDATPEPVAAPEPKPLPANVQEAKARARVIRIRRADPVAPAALAEAAADPKASLLSPEAEAALQAELRELEAELSLDLAEEDLAPEIAADNQPDDADLENAVADLPETADIDTPQEAAVSPKAADLEIDDFDIADIDLSDDSTDVAAAQTGPADLDDSDDLDGFDFGALTADETPAPKAASLADLDEDDEPALLASLAETAETETAQDDRAEDDSADLPPAEPVQPARPLRAVRSIVVQRPAEDASKATEVHEPSEDDIRAAISALLSSEPPIADAKPMPVHVKLHKMLETQAGEEAVSRILAQTNTELAGSENRRRISAIQHLKAAVAATMADRVARAAGPAVPEVNPQAAYRNDLVKVTRPLRSDAGPTERPSPLVLVSELRIDRPKPASQPMPSAAPRVVMPRRPRRLGASATMAAAQNDDSLFGMDDEDDVMLPGETEANVFDGTNSFADFAESLGASSLQDLLEASAVYCGEVLGREFFSRVQVLQQLETIDDAPARNREDELRAFGTLMREGRIVKVKRGQFAITAQSPLLAEAKRLA